MRIAALIPSYNRASQLRLLLESIERNCPNTFRFYVLRKAGDSRYRAGYEKLEKERVFKNVCWAWEDEDRGNNQVRGFLEAFADDYCSLWTDDCVFYRPLDADAALLTSLLTNDVWAVSLRLGLNANCHSYINNHFMAPLEVEDTFYGEKYISWDFKKRDPFENYGYYFAWDGIIYRTKEVRDILDGGYPYQSVRHIECYAVNCGARERMPYRKLVSPKNSVVFCQNCNSTHPDVNYGGRFGISLQELNERYLAGEVIDLDSMNFSGVNGCHQEIPFRFRSL